MDVKVVSKNVGTALLVSAAFMFLSIIVSLLSDMDSSFGPLAISFIITFILGIFPHIFVGKTNAISLRDGYLIIVLSWLLSFVCGMLPYLLWGGEFTIVNAWYESVAGFTTTGSTILEDIEVLPNGLLFWRSSTHFIGGLGIVVFLLVILPDSSPFRLRLTNLELSALSKDGYRYRSTRQVRVIMTVYLSIFVASFFSLWLAGMPVFDAVNHAFSLTATGGFSTKNASIGFYDSTAINIIVMVFMLLSAMHFGMLYAVVATRSLKPLKHPVTKYFLSCVVVLATILSVCLKLNYADMSWGKSIENGFFGVISYITTTGFAIADNSQWPPLACAILMVCAFQCACSGSTTGGIKADRVFILGKAISRQIRRTLHPANVSTVKVGNHSISDDVLLPVVTYVALYFIVVIASIVLLLFCGVLPMDAISGSIASVGNVGPGLGQIGTAGNYYSQPAVAKFIYSIDMIFGRLEIYPILVSIGMLFQREN